MIVNKITESAIEKFAIELLEKSGCQYIYATSSASASASGLLGLDHTQPSNNVREEHRMKKNLPDYQRHFLLYNEKEGKASIDVFLKDKTVWFTQKAMDQLLGVESIP